MATGTAGQQSLEQGLTHYTGKRVQDQKNDCDFSTSLR
jgi:hypothetical protein